MNVLIPARAILVKKSEIAMYWKAFWKGPELR
jgi:hypothetical protein